MLDGKLDDKTAGKIVFAEILNQNGCDTGVDTGKLFKEWLEEDGESEKGFYYETITKSLDGDAIVFNIFHDGEPFILCATSSEDKIKHTLDALNSFNGDAGSDSVKELKGCLEVISKYIEVDEKIIRDLIRGIYK